MRRMPSGAYSVLLLVCLAISCTSSRPFEPGRNADREGAAQAHTLQSGCTPSFSLDGGWLGGDAAYSIALPYTERSLWLFGDTFVGEPGAVDRHGAHFIHNSIGISRCLPDGSWTIEYFWGSDEGGQPRAFFQAAEEGRYVWPFDGFVHAGLLYVGLLEVEPAEPQGPLGLPFRAVGMYLARIDNYLEDPAEWRLLLTRVSASASVLPASAMVSDDAFAYFYTFGREGSTRHPRGLVRLRLSELEADWEDLPAALEYLADSGGWRPGIEGEDARLLMEDDASEMSVRFHPRLGKWLAVYNFPRLAEDTDSSPVEIPGRDVYLRVAARPAGPWSAPLVIHRIPEAAAAGESGVFCYAAKEHAQFATQERILVTYVCNLRPIAGRNGMQTLERLLGNLGIYYPIAISLPPPQLEGTWPASE